MNNKKISILGLCFLCFFILFSCNKEANGKMQGSEQEIVLREEGGDFGYPNPFRHQNRGPGFFKMELIYDSLLEKDEKGLIPWLAKEWTVSEDGQDVYVHHERQYGLARRPAFDSRRCCFFRTLFRATPARTRRPYAKR